MSKIYRSPYEAYPFLCDDSADLRCDFELLTDEMSSGIGLLRSKLSDEPLREELLWLCELVYHMNPTLRTRLTVTKEETERLAAAVERLQKECGERCKRFVLTQGCENACISHILRVQGKNMVRLLYRHCRQGNEVPEMLIDLANLLSGYFFYLSLKLNELEGVDEIPYISRNY